MYRRVSGAKFWLLGYCTLGIYPLVVWHRMAKNLNRMAPTVGDDSIGGFIGAYLLGLVTFGIYPLIWMIRFFCLAARLNEKGNAGVAPANGFLMFLMSCIPVYSFFWMAKMNNELVDAYQNM